MKCIIVSIAARKWRIEESFFNANNKPSFLYSMVFLSEQNVFALLLI